MAFFNTPVAALLLSLSLAVSSGATAYTTIAATPDFAPSLSPDLSPAPSPDYSYEDFDPLNRFTIPKDEEHQDSQYLKAHMQAAAHQVELFLANEVEKRLNTPDAGASEKQCLEVCREVYESAVDAMKTGMESVSSGNFIKANFDVSAFGNNIDTCNDCFDEFQKFDDWAKAVTDDCLDKIGKYSLH